MIVTMNENVLVLDPQSNADALLVGKITQVLSDTPTAMALLRGMAEKIRKDGTDAEAAKKK